MLETVRMDFKLELVPLPVADIDRAKAFYADALGFHIDLDMAGDGFRVVQFTPPGSACSVAVGTFTTTPPGSVQGLHLVVTDIQAARSELLGRGADIGEVTEMTAPGRPSVYYAAFTDPDGNGWTLQQVGDAH